MLRKVALLTSLLPMLMEGIAYASIEGAAESEEVKFVRFTKDLEAFPLSEDSREIRAWLLDWATASKSISVTVCDVLGPIPNQDLTFGHELLTQSIFGNAAFQIQHPELKGNELLAQTAGMVSVLGAYSAILARHPEARIPYFDEMAEWSLAGELEVHMKPLVAEKCSDPGEKLESD